MEHHFCSSATESQRCGRKEDVIFKHATEYGDTPAKKSKSWFQTSGQSLEDIVETSSSRHEVLMAGGS